MFMSVSPWNSIDGVVEKASEAAIRQYNAKTTPILVESY